MYMLNCLKTKLCVERILYIYDAKKQYFDNRLRWHPKVPHMTQSIVNSFSWNDTPEGYEFWTDIHIHVIDFDYEQRNSSTK